MQRCFRITNLTSPPAGTGDDYVHLGGDELLQDALYPHDCWEQAPLIAAWMNATFKPAGRDPRGTVLFYEHIPEDDIIAVVA